MIVECPTCGTRNRLSDELRVGRIYRCGACKASIQCPSDLLEDEGPLDPAPGLWDNDEQEAALIEERPFSVKRMLGAALFGCLLGSYATKACDYTIPRIISMIQGINEVTATEQYEASAVFPFLTFAFGALLGSGVAAFLARKHTVLTGLLAGAPFAVLFLTFTVLAVARGDADLVGSISYQLYEFLLFATVVVASVAGALIAEHVFDSSWDPDLKQSKVTIFGIRWGHYFWILPLVVYPCLASLIMAIYAGVLAFLSSFYVALHPSLWFSFGWMASFGLNPMAVYAAFWLVLQGMERFVQVMAPGPRRMSKLAKFWRVILYGVLMPTLAFSVAAISASFTHALPKPTPGDWKIGLAVGGGFAVLSLGAQAVSWLRDWFKDRQYSNAAR
jgi:hypothetical protein